MTRERIPVFKESFLGEIEKILLLYEHGDYPGAYDTYDALEKQLAETSLLDDDALLDLFLETEFLIYEHGSTSLDEVKTLFARTATAQPRRDDKSA